MSLLSKIDYDPYLMGIKLISVCLISYRSYKKKSLNTLGVFIAFLTGIIHSLYPLSGSLCLLFGFFLSGTFFTKMKADVKEKYVDSINTFSSSETTRGAKQVLCNSVIATGIILYSLYSILYDDNFREEPITIALIMHYVAVTADTWSSEIGILSKSDPILITTLRKVPRGTNGGVTINGLSSAFVGGGFIGFIAVLSSLVPINLSKIETIFFIALCAYIGIFASLLDSFLGAVFQASVTNKKGQIIETNDGSKVSGLTSNKLYSVSGLDLLSNNQVNLLMTAIVTGVSYKAASEFF